MPGLGRFRGDEPGFRSWVFTVARMRAVDAARQAARRPVWPVPTELLPERPARDDPAEAALEAQATAEALALIAELPPDHAEVVTLRVVAGLNVAQVAELVGRRPGTVRVLAHPGTAATRPAAGRAGAGVTRWLPVTLWTTR